jgi:hypothetical protein
LEVLSAERKDYCEMDEERKRLAKFIFVVPLANLGTGSSPLYGLEIPERVSAAIGRRGPVPIVATLNRSVEIQASLVPMGGGRHRLQLNARTRAELQVKSGDRIRVALVVPKKPPRLPVPGDLGQALQEVGLWHTFDSFPVGKQNHIILWIEEAARPQTRNKRIETTLQFVFRARERVHERQTRAKFNRRTDLE